MNKKFSFVILAYNSKKTIDDCLNSIFDKTKDLEAEVIVVDNNSPDQSGKYVMEKYGNKVIVIENPKNEGFARGMNLGLERATGNYLVMLNPDATLQKIDFSVIDERFRSERIGLMSGKIVFPDGKTQPSFGMLPTKWRLILYYTKLYKYLPGGVLMADNFWNKRRYLETSKVGWIAGSFMITTKKILEEINYFDPKYFLYWEDADLCKRIKDKGYELLIDPKIVVSHISQHSAREKPIEIFRHEINSLIYFFKKHYNKDETKFFEYIYRLKKKRLEKKGK